MTSLLAFIFVLGVLVFVHEAGHFVMARRMGVRVLCFSLGFGPKILKYRRGDTEYCVSAIPLGGYVKMAGESPDDPRSGRDDEFMSKTKWQRFLILVMGPATNIIFAIVVMTVVLYQGAEVPLYEQQPPEIGTVVEESPAERAGIRPGDLVLQVAGRPVQTWMDLQLAVLPHAGSELEFVIRGGDGAQRTARLTPQAEGQFRLGEIGVLPQMHPQVRRVLPGEPAELAGIRVDDAILAVNGEPVENQGQLIAMINASAGVPLTLTIRRDDTLVDTIVTPAARGDVGLIGVTLSELEIRIIEPGPLEAVRMSVEQNYEWSGLIFRTLWGLLTRETPLTQLVGPVGIAQLSGTAAQVGWVTLFGLMAMISLNLGILNLLPIPVLDGGHIFIMALEGVSRREFSLRVKEAMLLAGFVVLMTLIVTVVYNDLVRIESIERLLPWK